MRARAGTVEASCSAEVVAGDPRPPRRRPRRALWPWRVRHRRRRPGRIDRRPTSSDGRTGARRRSRRSTNPCRPPSRRTFEAGSAGHLDGHARETSRLAVAALRGDQRDLVERRGGNLLLSRGDLLAVVVLAGEPARVVLDVLGVRVLQSATPSTRKRVVSSADAPQGRSPRPPWRRARLLLGGRRAALELGAELL